MLLGTAKLIPSLPPDCEKISELMPTTRPSVSTRGPPAVARIHGRVRLYVDHRILRAKLPRRRAHDPDRHGVLQPQRTAEGEHELTGPQIVRIGELQVRNAVSIDLQHGQIGLPVQPHEAGFEKLPARLEDRSSAQETLGRLGQLDTDAGRSLHDVPIGDDVALGIQDDAGPRASEPGHGALASIVRIRREPQTRCGDVDDGPTHALREGLKRLAELPQLACLLGLLGPCPRG